MAAHLRAGKLATFSLVCPRWPEANEERWMRAVVDCYRFPWHKVDVEHMLPFSRLPEGFHGEPTATVIDEEQLGVVNSLLASQGVAVMLSGHGGDAVLCARGGSVPVHLADALFDGDAIGAFRAMVDWKNTAKDVRSYSYWLLRTLVEPTVDHLRGNRIRSSSRGLRVPAWIKRDYASQMNLRQRARRHISWRCREPGRQALSDNLWLLALVTATNPQRRMGFEIRHPLMYRPLVEFMCGIPWEQKLRPRCDRYLQRRALKNILPEEIRWRATKGNASAALVEGLRRSQDWLDYLCDSPKLAERGIVDAEEWRQAVRRASVGQVPDQKLFLAAIAVEVWLKQLSEFRVRTPIRRRSDRYP
jgi:asparagine synthetase B (glutamine-hydrolysing)